MNRIERIFSKKGLPPAAAKRVKGLEWRAQEAGKSDVLFYNLGAGDKEALTLFKNRVENSNYGLLALNKPVPFKLRDCHSFSEEEFFDLRLSLADALYPIPDGLKFIGITGTNGKTTTVDIIRQLARLKKAGIMTIGTLGVYLNDQKIQDFGLTSPDFIDLRKIVAKHGEGRQICALEASSHAIEQNRLQGLRFAALGWTSFSQDHLDYHASMENYFAAKKKLLNYSDEKFVVSGRSCSLVEKIGDKGEVAKKLAPLTGEFFKSEFNMVNLEVALGCLEKIGYKFSSEELEKITPPPGRFNLVKDGERFFVIDFAHTPEAIENICKELRKSFPSKKLVIVFGCGGNRDRTKRPLMGKAASENSDFVIITSDNPRLEDPLQIISDIEAGMTHKNYLKISEREPAIAKAAEIFQDAVVLLAGKGHEAYIDMGGKKIPYSDMEVLERIINR